MIDFTEFKDKYIQDAALLLDSLESDLLMLGKNLADKSLADNIYRYLHTLKGSGGMYGFDKIVEITHQLEHIYKLIQEQEIVLNQAIIQLSISTGDHIRNLLSDTDLVQKTNIENQKNIISRIAEILEEHQISPDSAHHTNSTTPDTNSSLFEVHFFPDENISKRNLNLINVMRDIFMLSECNISLQQNEKGEYWCIKFLKPCTREQVEDALFFIVDDCEIIDIQASGNSKEITTKQEELHAIAEMPKAGESLIINTHEAASKSNRLQVDISRLNTLSFLVSELVTSKSALFTGIHERNMEIISQSAERIDKISRQFHANVLTLRLVPLKDLTLKFKRLIHDLSIKLNKKVDFITQGEETELDKGIIDEISLPIMHIIRNCIDHGLDTPEMRQLQGKTETGIIKLFAYKSGNFVFIQISDDGKGIDTRKILSKAIEKGLIAPDSKPTEKEIFNMIFLPGLSTAEELSEISGRGIGMDIVKRKIQDLRGEIYVDSEKDLGSIFTIKLQQNISIIDTMLIQCGNSKFAIPVEDIENFEVGHRIDFWVNASATFQYKNEILPVVNLKKFLNIEESDNLKTKLIIVNKYSKRFGLVVDRIIGEHQAVVKPLRKSFRHLSYYTGASTLGDGTLAFLLDVNKIGQLSEVKQT